MNDSKASAASLNRPSAVIAAVIISFTGVGTFLVLPIFIGAAATDLGLSGPQLGILSAAVMSGAAASSLLALFWVRKLPWRKSMLAALALLMAGHIASIFASSMLGLTIASAVASLGGGSAYALALTILSDNEHPERAFGFSVAAQVSFQVLGLLILPTLVAANGLDAVLVSLIVVEIVALTMVRYLPDHGVPVADTNPLRGLFKPQVLLVLLGSLLFFVNVVAIWTYIERMGTLAGFSAEFIGNGLALGVSVGIVGALLASWCGERFGRIGPLTLGAFGTVIAAWLWLGQMDAFAFIAGALIYNFVWNFSLTFQFAAVNAADDTGVAVAAAPAFQGAGGAIGPVMAAFWVTADSLVAVNYLAMGSVLLSLLFFLLAKRASSD